MANWLSSFFAPEFEGKALQKSGTISKEQLLSFFEHGKELFDNPDFKMALARGYQQGQDPQELINQAQARIWEDKVQPAVQGDYGLQNLSVVLGQYQSDQEFLKHFYEFVHLEEKTLDEAEMPANEFESKYAKISQIKDVMEAQMAQHEQTMQGMSDEERQRYMADVYKAMVDMGLGMSAPPPACARPGAGGRGPAAMAPPMPPAPTTAPPQPVEAPAADAPVGGIPGLPVRPSANRQAMGEQEQLAFFQSLQRAGASGAQ